MSQISAVQGNMQRMFSDNPHRGIALGMDNNSSIFQLSWIMGRSSNSQNRVYAPLLHSLMAVGVKTTPFDESTVEDPSLIIYNAMDADQRKNVFVVSNGDQTDSVTGEINERRGVPSDCFYTALETRFCEPDAPIFTPRITGMQEVGSDMVYLSVLRADPEAKEHWTKTVETLKLRGVTIESFKGEGISFVEAMRNYNLAVGKEAGLNHREFPTIHSDYAKTVNPGMAYCVMTYNPGDSANLPSFDRSPFLIPVLGGLESTMKNVWDNLDTRWRVALAGRTVESDGAIYIPESLSRFTESV